MDANYTDSIYNNSMGTYEVIPTAFSIVYIIVYVIVFVLTIGGNLLVLTAIAKVKKLQTVTNVFLANLAVADLMFGAINVPIALLNIITVLKQEIGPFYYNKYPCIFSLSIWNTVYLESLFSLFGLSCERYIAVLRPLYHSTSVTKRSAFVIAVTTWLVSLSISFLPFFDVEP